MSIIKDPIQMTLGNSIFELTVVPTENDDIQGYTTSANTIQEMKLDETESKIIAKVRSNDSGECKNIILPKRWSASADKQFFTSETEATSTAKEKNEDSIFDAETVIERLENEMAEHKKIINLLSKLRDGKSDGVALI